jgi:nitrogen-specific signal transduction histidine kinase
VDIDSTDVLLEGRAARLVLAMDVSERKRLEGQLAQSQKMEAVGRLAGGVAHDFNNLLGVISGYSELLGRSLLPDDPGRRRLDQIRQATDQATALTRQLLAFSRKELIQPTVLDLNQVVSDIGSMLERLIGEDVELVTKAAEGLGRALADRGQMEQVLVNLAVNARDAMPHGGHLIIETANVRLDEAYAQTHPDAAPGPYVMLAVSDTGHGMDAATLSHIFEPFFTTKEPGKGTGLGLATVFGIAKQNGGHVNVYSEVGNGATFRLYLPRVDAPVKEAATPVAPPATRGTETILLVEDADALRSMIAEILEGAGYRVIESAHPEDAVKRVEAHAGTIDLILTDVVMPGTSGPHLVDAVRVNRGDVKALFMSGYTNEAMGRQGVLEPGTNFLQKPFTTQGLLGAVRRALDEK